MPGFPFRLIEIRKRRDNEQKNTLQPPIDKSYSQISSPTPALRRKATKLGNQSVFVLTDPTPGTSGLCFFAGGGSRLAQRRLQNFQSKDQASLADVPHHRIKENLFRSRSISQLWKVKRFSSSSALLNSQLKEIRKTPSMTCSSAPEIPMDASSTLAIPSTIKTFAHSFFGAFRGALDVNNFRKFQGDFKGSLSNSPMGPLEM